MRSNRPVGCSGPSQRRRWRVVGSWAAFAAAWLACDEPLRETEVAPLAVVAGLVREPPGNVVSGSLVLLEATTSVAHRGQGTARKQDIRATRSDAHGRFSFSAVAPGRYIVSGSAPHHLSAAMTVEVGGPVAVVGGETTTVLLDLVPTGAISGVVTLQFATTSAFAG